MIASSPILRKPQTTEVIPDALTTGNSVEIDDLESNGYSEICDQSQLEDILEERDKGPFIPVPHDLVDRVMERAMARIRQRQAHV
jgi:hypothetical protein